MEYENLNYCKWKDKVWKTTTDFDSGGNIHLTFEQVYNRLEDDIRNFINPALWEYLRAHHYKYIQKIKEDGKRVWVTNSHSMIKLRFEGFTFEGIDIN